MIKFKRRLLLIGVMFTFIAVSFFSLSGFALAELEDKESVQTVQSDASPYLLTTLTLAIGGENNYVWAKVRNDFTLGFATVNVYVELYSSIEYQDSYSKMQLESENYIYDLNIFQTVETKAPTKGIKRYWIARAYFRADKGEWSEKVTSVWLFDGSGNVVT